MACELARETDTTGTTQTNPSAPPPVMVAAAPPVDDVSPSNSSSISQSEVSLRRKNRLSDDPRIPAWLVSTIIHTLLLVLLALLAKTQSEREGYWLTARRSDAEPSLNLRIANQPIRKPTDTDSKTELPVTVTIAPQLSSVTESVSIDHSESTEQTETDFLNQMLAGGASASNTLSLPNRAGGLSGRTPERRRELGKKYGATRESEEAVELALKWLAAHQGAGGGWSFDLRKAPCNGRCRHAKEINVDLREVGKAPSTAATGLAVLAFLGAGYTHESGPYAEQIEKAIYYLRTRYTENEAGYDWQEQQDMYGHGIALFALAEALSMTTTEGEETDTMLKHLVEMGTLFTLVAQHSRGGWGYEPGSPGDTTQTGWQVMSLLSAKRSRIALRTHTLGDAKDFLLRLQGEQAFSFGYNEANPKPRPTTSAIGLSMMLYLGESPHTNGMHLALNRLAERGPALTNIYHDYYGTLALHHARHYEWDAWNQVVRDHLVATQEKQGHETGSWHFDDPYGNVGGRLYTTAMAAMTLEIYYRYLPLYESVEKFPL